MAIASGPSERGVTNNSLNWSGNSEVLIRQIEGLQFFLLG
jgi:hypothetical protein